MLILFSIGVFFILCSLSVFYDFINSPEGWEDEDGFHKGKEPYTPLSAKEIAQQMCDAVNKSKKEELQ